MYIQFIPHHHHLIFLPKKNNNLEAHAKAKRKKSLRKQEKLKRTCVIVFTFVFTSPKNRKWSKSVLYELLVNQQRSFEHRRSQTKQLWSSKTFCWGSADQSEAYLEIMIDEYKKGQGHEENLYSKVFITFWSKGLWMQRSLCLITLDSLLYPPLENC